MSSYRIHPAHVSRLKGKWEVVGASHPAPACHPFDCCEGCSGPQAVRSAAERARVVVVPIDPMTRREAKRAIREACGLL